MVRTRKWEPVPPILWFLGGATALALSILSAAAQGPVVPGNAIAGLEIAQKSCTGCHQISESSTAPVQVDVPTFSTIAGRDGASEERIAGFIVVPHKPMPALALSRRDVADLAAYIISLR